MTKKKPNKKANMSPDFNKYVYYEKAVQNPSNEVEFFNEKFKEIRKREPKTLREDFCGTAAISCAWVDQSPEHFAYGVDLDPEPVEYGKENHYARLDAETQTRMKYILGNVLDTPGEKTDITFAFNFSYMIFKERSILLNYFKKAYESLKDDGVFFLDLFGGPDSQTEMTDVIEHKGFKYYWECMEFNPINNHCTFGIHFKRKGEKKRKEVFTYEWRLWSLPELRDLLVEAGFKTTIAYWEGDDEDGGGNGEFYQTETAENCDAWVTYIAAVK